MSSKPATTEKSTRLDFIEVVHRCTLCPRYLLSMPDFQKHFAARHGMIVDDNGYITGDYQQSDLSSSPSAESQIPSSKDAEWDIKGYQNEDNRSDHEDEDDDEGKEIWRENILDWQFVGDVVCSALSTGGDVDAAKDKSGLYRLLPAPATVKERRLEQLCCSKEKARTEASSSPNAIYKCLWCDNKFSDMRKIRKHAFLKHSHEFV